MSARTALGRRLLPLQVAGFVQGFVLWVPVEKLFMSQIGFTATSIGVMAAAYSITVPLLEVPSGIVADRWSRTWLMVAGSVCLAARALVGALSHSVATYVVAAVLLGVFLALSSGTVDSVVYDAVLEETGTAELYEVWIGRIRMVESAALVASSLLGGLVAGWWSPRTAYWLSVPTALLSVVGFAMFREPTLHRRDDATSLREQARATVRAITRRADVRRTVLLGALTGIAAQTIFEFGPLWLVYRGSDPALFGPYWAVLVATIGLAGYLITRVRADAPGWIAVGLILLVGCPVALGVAPRSLAVIVVAQVLLALVLGIIGIHAGKLVHDAVDSSVRAGVSSGVGTLTWLLFVPLSLATGWLTRHSGVSASAWLLLGVCVALGLLLMATAAGPPVATATEEPPEVDVRPLAQVPVPTDLACEDVVTVLTDYLDGAAPAAWREALDAHLDACHGCAAYAAALRALVASLGALPDLVVSEGSAPRPEPDDR